MPQTPNRSNRGRIPSIFCWTKMGTEAGQPLDLILQRKELERRAGNGVFAWGIGNSLGDAPKIAREASPTGEIDVLFSPMKSPAKAEDISPSEILLWLNYYDSDGYKHDLPAHIAITSRGSHAKASGKRAHYALLCSSDKEISFTENQLTINFCQARNFTSLNPLGASQVTAMVRYKEQIGNGKTNPYRVLFSAIFHREGFVRLANPVNLDADLIKLYKKLCESKSVLEWTQRVKTLRDLASAKTSEKKPANNINYFRKTN